MERNLAQIKYPRAVEVKVDKTGLYTITVLPALQDTLKRYWNRPKPRRLTPTAELPPPKPYKWFSVTVGNEDIVFKGFNENKCMKLNRLGSKPVKIMLRSSEKRFADNQGLDKLCKASITTNDVFPNFGEDDYMVTLRYDLRVEKIDKGNEK